MRSSASGSPRPEGGDNATFAVASSHSQGKEGRIRPWAVRSDRRVLALALVFCAANALLVRTYFNPDEHWQCLEVAHRVAFGYGHLTWEWKRGLRSYLHPLIFAALYKILALLHLDTPWLMSLSNSLETVLTVAGIYYWFIAIESSKGS